MERVFYSLGCNEYLTNGSYGGEGDDSEGGGVMIVLIVLRMGVGGWGGWVWGMEVVVELMVVMVS